MPLTLGPRRALQPGERMSFTTRSGGCWQKGPQVLRLASLKTFTIFGSRWSKKLLVLVSSVAMASISSGLSSKSNTSKFSAMRSLRTDLGMATTPRWVSQRRMICATVFLYFAARASSNSFWKMLFLPSANGPQDSICTLFSCRNFWVFDLLAERVGFDLVHRRHHLVVKHQVHHPVGVEVADADGPDPAFPVQLFHGSPGAVDIAKGLVDQVQIEIIELQSLERSFERLLCALVTGIRDPQLGRDKQLFSCHTTAFDGSADCLFISVRRRGVNQAIAGADRFVDASFAFFGVSHLKDAKPQQGHLHPVVQCDRWNS